MGTTIRRIISTEQSSLPVIIFKPAVHQNQEVILIRFDKDYQIINRLKNIEGVWWSNGLRSWYIARESFNPVLFRDHLKNHASLDYSAISDYRTVRKAEKQDHLLSPGHAVALETYGKWLRHRRYSESTIRTYTGMIRLFLQETGDRLVGEVSNDHVVDYIYRHVVDKGYSFAYQNQMVSSLKLFFRVIANSEIDIEGIRRPRPEHRLPSVLSKEEVKQIITASSNIKHRTMLSLIYACGLRRSELLNLKPGDIDSKRRLLLVRRSKGYKDRLIPVSEKIIEMLREYYRTYRPAVWLFEGWQSGDQYSPASLQKVLKQSVRKAGIRKPVTLHWLRHSYATHLLESGTDLRYIQELLGHKSSRTTEIYTHVSVSSIQKIRSPFDDL
ncbi:MAG TPA: tyrosine-type recombinase/integrase [Bacteroidales bacterium]|jgi:integrase/recombinase XerD|nr:tyrosine-type recombinase/integrase [Bacteroidales bacterium]HQH24230.1 tyrosine-type recombinase/integrase [Bacteroidales bacterium]